MKINKMELWGTVKNNCLIAANVFNGQDRVQIRISKQNQTLHFWMSIYLPLLQF